MNNQETKESTEKNIPTKPKEPAENTKNENKDEFLEEFELKNTQYLDSYDPHINLKYPKINLQKNDDISNLLNKRVELNEKTATIKYVGPLKHKKDANQNEIWFGLEWDDVTRGKHNGTVENFEYFKTKNNLNSGSLIKSTKVNIGQTFKGALGYKYNFYEEEGNDLHKDIDKALEKDNFISTDKKIINIELVGKEKAAKKFSQFEYMTCIDLSFSYINNLGNNLNEILPRLKELSLTRTLLTKWNDLLSVLIEFKNLNLLNFSENILQFDDLYEENIKKFISGELKQNLHTLVLNKCNLTLYDLIKLSPLFTKLDYLYLRGNEINPNEYENSENKKYIDENIGNIQKNTENLKYLSLEQNKITNFIFSYKIFQSPILKYINLNQNLISNLIENKDDKDEKNLITSLKKSVTHISLDYNMFKEEKFDKIMIDLESLELKDIDILNNGFIDKVGIKKAKMQLIGRNPQLTILNNTTITKIMRRDAEKEYLVESVKNYISSLGNKSFDQYLFEKYMLENHKQYFKLRKKFFDPLDDYENLTKKKSTNAMKNNMSEIVLKNGEKTIKRKFPKSTVISNLKNLCIRLFKIDADSLFSFYLEKEGKEELIEDETLTLESLNLPAGQVIFFKNKS